MRDVRKADTQKNRPSGFIKQAESGMSIKELCCKGGFSDATFNKRRAKYGRTDVSNHYRLCYLVGKNAKLKQLLAKVHLEIYSPNTTIGIKRQPHDPSAHPAGHDRALRSARTARRHDARHVP